MTTGWRGGDKLELSQQRFRLKLQEANLQPPELAQTPRKHEVPAAWSRVRRERGPLDLRPPPFQSVSSPGLGLRRGPGLLCWEVGVAPGPRRCDREASWRLGNWEGSEDSE